MGIIIYIIIFHLFCAITTSLIARKRSRNSFLWFFAGFFLSFFALLLIVFLNGNSWMGKKRTVFQKKKSTNYKKRPKRCCGRYIPDCEGCPYFQRPLFEAAVEDIIKGRCMFFKRTLKIESTNKNSRVIIEEEEGKDEDESPPGS